jgi:hypothetical protein
LDYHVDLVAREALVSQMGAAKRVRRGYADGCEVVMAEPFRLLSLVVEARIEVPIESINACYR